MQRARHLRATSSGTNSEKQPFALSQSIVVDAAGKTKLVLHFACERGGRAATCDFARRKTRIALYSSPTRFGCVERASSQARTLPNGKPLDLRFSCPRLIGSVLSKIR